MTDERVEAYAEIAVRIGANVQPGQEVFLNSLVEHAQVTRALARQAYRAGASYVNALYYDMTPFLHRAMLEHGPEEALTHTPPWLRKYVESYDGNALLATIGDPDPALSAGLDEGRVGRAHMAELLAIRQREHLDRLDARAAALTELRPDAIRYRGPGTDLTVGLLPSARWMSARFRTAGGIQYVANMPTEEIFTTPDSTRADGTVRSSMPLVHKGQLIEGLQLTLKDGRTVGVDAERGAEIVREELETIENTDRLGELALVTGESRVGQTGTVFYNTLFDENATCH